MKKRDTVQFKVDETFNTLNAIEKVAVPTFFKHRVLQIVKDKVNTEFMFSWFTPSLQLVSLIVVLFINTTVIYYSFSSSSNMLAANEIEAFAQEYNLTTDQNSILN
jgi:hypothetical protein